MLFALMLIIGFVTALIFYSVKFPLWSIPLGFIGGCLALVVVFLLIAYVISLFCPYYKKDENGKVIERENPHKIYLIFILWVCDFLRTFLRVKVELKNEHLLPTNEGFLLVCNHQSLLDPILILGSFKRKDINFIMKKEIRRIPIAGRWLYNSGYYFLNRQNNREGLQTVLNSINVLKKGKSIGVFIEGTRSKGPKLGEFHDASLKMALKSGVKVVVCTIDNTYLVKSRFPFRRTKVFLKICAVINKEEYEALNTIEFSGKIHDIMEDSLKLERGK